jgi:hypothetical protein
MKGLLSLVVRAASAKVQLAETHSRVQNCTEKPSCISKLMQACIPQRKSLNPSMGKFESDRQPSGERGEEGGAISWWKRPAN